MSEALVHSLRSCGTLLVLIATLLFGYSMIGVEVFGGMFYSCRCVCAWKKKIGVHHVQRERENAIRRVANVTCGIYREGPRNAHPGTTGMLAHLKLWHGNHENYFFNTKTVVDDTPLIIR